MLPDLDVPDGHGDGNDDMVMDRQTPGSVDRVARTHHSRYRPVRSANQNDPSRSPRMESSRFDALVRALDRSLSRRGALGALLGPEQLGAIGSFR